MKKSGHIVHSEIAIGACMRGERQDAERILFSTGIQDVDMPNDFFVKVYEGILSVLRNPTSVPTPELVWTATGREVNLDDVKALVDAAGTRSVMSSVDSANTVIKLADRRATYDEIKYAFDMIQDESISADEVRSKLVSELSKTRSSIQPSDTRSIRSRVMNKIGTGEIEPIPLTIPWFNYLTNGGIRSRRLFAIAGGEKSRKTTLTRNLILGALRKLDLPDDPAKYIEKLYVPREDVRVAFLAFENDQETTWFDFVSMLAWDKLWRSGIGKNIVETQMGTFFYYELLNPELIMTAMDNGKIKKWPVVIQKAIDEAMDTLDDLNLHIYDMNAKNGGLDTVDDMTRVINMHNVLYCKPDDKKMLCIDYAGLVRTPGMTDFQGQTEVVNRALYSANALDFAVMLLAQYSRGYTREHKDSKNRTTVGTENSAALERGCHHYWEVSYDEDSPQILDVQQVRARRQGGGLRGKTRQKFHIDKVTGSIIDQYTSDTVFLKE